MSFLLPVLLALSQPTPLPAAPPALTEETAAALLRRSPAFTGGNSARGFVRVRQLKRFQEGAQEGWLAELEWKEGDKTRVGVAPIARANAPHDDRWYFEQDGWAVVAVAEDKTIEQLVDMLKGAKVRSFEAAALGDVRTIISAEYAFQAGSGGSFAELRTLAEPVARTPGAKDPAFLSKELASLVDKTGYRRKFYPGPKTKGGFSAFAYTAVPVRPGETGVRAFCGDDTGRICFTTDGTEPPVVNGRCSPSCQELK